MSNQLKAGHDVEEALMALRNQCREVLLKEDNPEGKALLETTAEVLNSLQHVFHEYLEREDSGEVVSPKSIEPWD